MRQSTRTADVAVIGAGIAGTAASLHLAKAGLKVMCIDPQEDIGQSVGESLDWSAPELLRVLGLPMNHLVQAGVATYKRHVTLRLKDGSSRHYLPPEYLARRPYNVELKTIHVDRGRLDAALRALAVAHGVTFILDRVTAVETDGRRVTTVRTAADETFSARWFVDASGASASLLPKTFRVPGLDYGPKKVALWTYFPVPELTEGTTIYMDCGNPGYLEWIWEIPVRADRISVGYVATGEAVKQQRQRGLSVEEIFKNKLAQYPRFEALLQNNSSFPVSTRAFRCRVHRGVSGPNWVVMGEAASMVDPMTSNGVTAALRHAAEGTDLIIRARNRGKLSWLGRAVYDGRIASVGKFFNYGIETVIYQGPVRRRLGGLTAGDVYTGPAWSLNVVYSRLLPSGPFLTGLYSLVLGLFRTAASLYDRFCRRKATAIRVPNTAT
jgi:menaquinone-9 beta-reductase